MRKTEGPVIPPRREGINADTCCAASQNRLPVRPAGGAVAANCSVAAGAVLPDADHGLFAEDRARGTLHQLAAGPAEQLPGTAGFPGTRPAFFGGSWAGGRDDGDQPVRFFSGKLRRKDSVPVRRSADPGTAALCDAAAGGAGTAAAARNHRALGARRTASFDGFSGGSQPAAAKSGAVRDPDGAGGPDFGRDFDARERVVPGFGVAAGADSAAPGPGGAVRVGVLDSA